MTAERVPDPSFDSEGVPLCRPHCPYHDGKRCEILGHRPERICEPQVVRMAADLRVAGRLLE